LAGCEEFLDVNTNPNAPQTVAANLYLPPMLHWLVSTGQQWDGRFIGATPSSGLPGTAYHWDRMGYDPGSDNGGQHWRTCTGRSGRT
jgi:hypothetical protein